MCQVLMLNRNFAVVHALKSYNTTLKSSISTSFRSTVSFFHSLLTIRGRTSVDIVAFAVILLPNRWMLPTLFRCSRLCSFTRMTFFLPIFIGSLFASTTEGHLDISVVPTIYIYISIYIFFDVMVAGTTRAVWPLINIPHRSYIIQ